MIEDEWREPFRKSLSDHELKVQVLNSFRVIFKNWDPTTREFNKAAYDEIRDNRFVNHNDMNRETKARYSAIYNKLADVAYHKIQEIVDGTFTIEDF